MQSIIATLRALGGGVLSSAAVVAAATIFWLHPGDTVMDGPPAASALSLGLLTVGFTAARWISGAGRGIGVRSGLLAAQGSILTAAVILWQATHLYYLGWLAAFGSFVLLLASTWYLLRDLLVPPSSPATRSRRAAAAYIATGHYGIPMAGAALGSLGVVITGSVHNWRMDLISPIIVNISLALLMTAGLSAGLRRILNPGAASGRTNAPRTSTGQDRGS